MVPTSLLLLLAPAWHCQAVMASSNREDSDARASAWAPAPSPRLYSTPDETPAPVELTTGSGKTLSPRTPPEWLGVAEGHLGEAIAVDPTAFHSVLDVETAAPKAKIGKNAQLRLLAARNFDNNFDSWRTLGHSSDPAEGPGPPGDPSGRPEPALSVRAEPDERETPPPARGGNYNPRRAGCRGGTAAAATACGPAACPTPPMLLRTVPPRRAGR